jgi:pimeloyl-ACP methyl ester carboxylesterase
MIRREVEVGRLRIVCTEAGHGPTSILVPGLGLSARFYEASPPAFAAAGHRLLVPDPPGFGSSTAPQALPDILAMARLLADFAAAAGVREAAWIGHSVSAQTCLALAANRPDLVTRLVLVGPTGASRRALLRQAAGLAREATRAPLRTIGAVAADYIHTSPRRYLALWLAAARADTLAHARRAHCPTLLVVGTADAVVPADALARLLDVLPDGRLIHVPGAGHALPHEDPVAFHRVILPFLTPGHGQGHV